MTDQDIFEETNDTPTNLLFHKKGNSFWKKIKAESDVDESDNDKYTDDDEEGETKVIEKTQNDESDNDELTSDGNKDGKKAVVKSHNFEKTIKRIEKFSKTGSTEISIPGVYDRGWFIFKKVHADDINNALEQIQECFIELNGKSNKTIEEFREVYKALSTLDKEYISGILTSLKANEKTSNEVKKNQERIKRSVDSQKRIIEVLQSFQKKLEKYKHLGDIDDIWRDCQKWHDDICNIDNRLKSVADVGIENYNSIKQLSDDLSVTNERTLDLSNKLSQQIERLEVIIDYTNELKSIVHLPNVDEMWERLDNTKNELSNICTTINSIEDTIASQHIEIDKLTSFMDKLSGYEHLKDVDELWHRSDEHSNEIRSLFEAREHIEADMTEMSEKNDNAVKTLSKKLLYAYILAGGALGVSVIELILLIFGVI